MTLRTQHIRGFLRQSDAVSALLDEIQRRERLLLALRAHLPRELQGHCRQATLVAGRLIVSVDSPVWAGRLRFLSPQFCAALETEGWVVRDCQVRVAPLPSGPATGTRRSAPQPPGPEAAELLRQAADCLGDSVLSDSLRRLAGHVRQSGQSERPESQD
ncbi:DciA family protein [Thiohalocapsa marina]|nr:DciA family protein [Thiohalocapsa marina]